MKPSLGEDVTSVVAIVAGAVLSSALTGVLFLREPAPHATLTVDVFTPEVHILRLYQPVLKMSGPEGPRTHWIPGPRLHERDLHELERVLEGARERSRPEPRTGGR